MKMKMKTYNITYEIIGTVTLPILANSEEDAIEQAMQEWPTTDINFNQDLVVHDRIPIRVVECSEGEGEGEERQ